MSGNGILASRFNHETSVKASTFFQHTEYAPAMRVLDEHSKAVRHVQTFKTEAVGPGYSGSPIFNERGEIASVVSGSKKRYGPHEDKKMPLHPEGHFYLVHPAVVSDFLRKNLG